MKKKKTLKISCYCPFNTHGFHGQQEFRHMKNVYLRRRQWFKSKQSFFLIRQKISIFLPFKIYFKFSAISFSFQEDSQKAADQIQKLHFACSLNPLKGLKHFTGYLWYMWKVLTFISSFWENLYHTRKARDILVTKLWQTAVFSPIFTMLSNHFLRSISWKVLPFWGMVPTQKVCHSPKSVLSCKTLRKKLVG